MLVGNKLDICQRDPQERAVSTLRAEEFARKNDLLFIETSAFTDTNVRDSFENLVQEIYNVRSHEEMNQRLNQGGKQKPFVYLDEEFDEGKKDNCC
mgnify:CR=1 FL=1